MSDESRYPRTTSDRGAPRRELILEVATLRARFCRRPKPLPAASRRGFDLTTYSSLRTTMKHVLLMAGLLVGPPPPRAGAPRLPAPALPPRAECGAARKNPPAARKAENTRGRGGGGGRGAYS